MIIYAMFAAAFLVGLHGFYQCIDIRMDNGRLTITEKPGPVVFAGLIKMDVSEAGIGFEFVRRGGAK